MFCFVIFQTKNVTAIFFSSRLGIPGTFSEPQHKAPKILIYKNLINHFYNQGLTSQWTPSIKLEAAAVREVQQIWENQSFQIASNLKAFLMFTLTSEMALCCDHSPACDDDRQIQSKSNIQVQPTGQPTPNIAVFVCSTELWCSCACLTKEEKRWFHTWCCKYCMRLDTVFEQEEDFYLCCCICEITDCRGTSQHNFFHFFLF